MDHPNSFKPTKNFQICKKLWSEMARKLVGLLFLTQQLLFFPAPTTRLLFCSDINNVVFVFSRHQQYGVCLVLMSKIWLSKLITAGKATRGCVTFFGDNLFSPCLLWATLVMAIGQWAPAWIFGIDYNRSDSDVSDQ